MFDPRDDIIGLFTSSRIGAASRYSGTSVYVHILTWEDHLDAEPDDYGEKTVGLLWLRPPRSVLQSVDIGYHATAHTVVVDAYLHIPVCDAWLKGIRRVFVNSIMDTFETRLRDEGNSKDGVGWDTIEVTGVPVCFDDVNPGVDLRVLEVTCTRTD